MQGDLVVVFGGSGFIGKQVVRTLAKRGKRVRVPMRRPHLGQDLRVLGDVGQIQLVQANIRYPVSFDAALEGADAVVNLTGVLYEKGPQSFRAIHDEGAGALAEAAKAKGITRFVHMSALGAGVSNARFARTKLAGEEAVRAALPEAIVVRPSIVFGQEDNFFNSFADMAKFAPALPLIGGGKTKFQPIYVNDLADAIANAIDMPGARGKTFEIGGPRTYTFKELMQFVTSETERSRPLLPLPFFAAAPMGMLLDVAFKLYPFAGPPLTGDQVTLLRRDNVVSQGAATIGDLGVKSLETVEAVVPSYLWRFRPYGQYQTRQRPT
jgi:uncharacterized protein YbjT (DUF2867 family)